MDTTFHPTSAAHINRESLAALVGQAGPDRVRILTSRFVQNGKVWALDTGLFFAPLTLTEVTGQVTLRFPGKPIRHLPLRLDDAKAWAAAWAILVALEGGQDVDMALICIQDWAPPANQDQATLDFGPILADFPESFLDATGRPDIRMTVDGFPVQLTLKDSEVVFPAIDNGGADVSVNIHVLSCIVKNARWAQALMMRWNASASGQAWAAAQNVNA